MYLKSLQFKFFSLSCTSLTEKIRKLNEVWINWFTFMKYSENQIFEFLLDKVLNRNKLL